MKPYCQNETVCYPVNKSGGVCQSKESIGGKKLPQESLIVYYIHHTGPCFNNSEKLKCDINGRFRTLQCYKNHSYCWCVHPSNGTVISDTLTNVELSKKLPECTDKGE